ncbi:MAG: hypothetical protein KDB53_19215, partial [Planctomycetes bacterium]|nr:hypothetical protein [Planctomycetota bacterium]
MKNTNPLLVLLTTCILVLSASAQVPLSGNVSDGAGGPLLSGTVYHASGFLTVPAGTTLTIQAGAILKMSFDGQLTVNGDLQVTGSAIVTEINDDTAGGDTNANGFSVGAPNFWRGVVFGAGATGVVNGLQVRFGGRFGTAGLEVNGNALSLSNCVVSACNAAGLDFNNVVGPTTVSNCQFDTNASAIEGVPLQSLAGFTGNTATGNAVHDTIRVSSATIASGTTTVSAANLVNGVVLAPGTTSIGTNGTLVFGPGVVYKCSIDAQFIVDGTLVCNGTAGSPVVITDINDDAHGGDTNNNGASAAVPNFWRGLVFNATSGASALSHTEVHGGGRFGTAAFSILGSGLSMNDCLAADCSAAGLNMNNIASSATITQCHVTACDRAYEGVRLESLPSLVNNTAAGNVAHDSVALSDGSITTGSTTISASNMVNNVALTGGLFLNVAAGASLTLDAGVILKWTVDGQLTVDGNLVCNGTAGSPVVFTTFSDDAHGGDSNKDGPSAGAANTWRGLRFNASSTGSQLTHAQVWYGGRFGTGGFSVNGAVATFNQCLAQQGSAAGIDLLNTTTTSTFNSCHVSGNAAAIIGVKLTSVSGFVNTTASGNGGFDSIIVSDATISSGTTTISAQNMVSGVITIPGLFGGVGAGAQLVLNAGCVLKWTGVDGQFTISGTLTCNGSAPSPVAFTTDSDDMFGGDSDENGASTVTANEWRGLRFEAGSAASTLNHTWIRGAGRFAAAGATVLDGITMRNCHLDTSSNAGLHLLGSAAQPTLSDCVVSACAVAMDGLSWRSFRNFAHNQVMNNVANYAQITTTTVGANDRVRAHNLPGGVVVLTVNPNFVSSSALTLEAGVTVKVTLDRSFDVNAGKLEVLGGGLRPVVFTDLADDDFGGDTNGDGPSTGSANFWRGLSIGSGALPSTVEHLVVRYGGRFATPGLRVNHGGVQLRAPRVDSCSATGLRVDAIAGDLRNAVAWGNAGVGLQLTGGSFAVQHATVAANNGGGIVNS